MNLDLLKKKIKKISFLWILLTRTKDQLIKLSRIKDVLTMMILFNVWPQQTYRFSTRKLLPGKKNRHPKELKPTIPYELLKNKNNLPMMKEINVVGIGSSFNLDDLKDMKGPIFLVSFWHPLRLDNNNKITYEHIISKKGKSHDYNKHKENFKDKSKNELNKDITYVHSRFDLLKLFKEAGYKILGLQAYAVGQNKEIYEHENNNMNQFFKSTQSLTMTTSAYLNLFNNDLCHHISLKENIFKPPLLHPHPNWAPSKSFLPALCGLSFLAEKINVYGWDYYLESSPEKMSYWQLFFNMYKFKADLGRGSFNFEGALVNFYYGYQLSKLPNFTIHGYMGKLQKHHSLINKIEKVLFN